MNNSDETIGNRNRDLPVCSALPQPNAPPRAPVNITSMTNTNCCEYHMKTPDDGQ